MRLDRLRSGLLSGPMPEAGATLELQRFPQRELPLTTNVTDTIGPGSWTIHDVNQAQKMNIPTQYTDALARSYIKQAVREHGPRPEIKSPEMGMELSELSNIVQGKSMGWTEDQAANSRGKYYERKGAEAGGDEADLPPRPTGPVVTADESDEMKSPLQQLQFLDPRYRGGWF